MSEVLVTKVSVLLFILILCFVVESCTPRRHLERSEATSGSRAREWETEDELAARYAGSSTYIDIKRRLEGGDAIALYDFFNSRALMGSGGAGLESYILLLKYYRKKYGDLEFSKQLMRMPRSAQLEILDLMKIPI